MSSTRVRRDVVYSRFARCLAIAGTRTFARVFSALEGQPEVPGDWWVEVLHCAAEMPACRRPTNSDSSGGQKECIQKQQI